MTATWPEALPQHLNAEGFSEALADNKLESQTDFGPGKSRRRFTSNWRTISGTLRCTDDQVDAFEDFYQDTLGGGVDAFLWRDPLSQNLSLMKFRGGPPRTQYRSADEFLIQITLWQKTIYAGLRFDSDEVSFDSTLATFDEATTY